MNEETKQWIKNADLTYCSARFLFSTGNPFLWFNGAYLLHQSVEKYIKTLLLSKGVKNECLKNLGHDIKKLFKKIICYFPELNIQEIKSFLNEIIHLNEFRYPDIKFRGDGLGEDELQTGDFIVTLIRGYIPSEIISHGIRKIVEYQLENFHLQLIKVLLYNNAESPYWIKELTGINKEINSFLNEYIEIEKDK